MSGMRQASVCKFGHMARCRRLIMRMALVPLAIVMLSGPARGETPSALNSRIWVAFGDSLVEQTDFAPDAGPWHQIVGNHFGVTVLNAGRSGDSTERAFARFEPEVLDHHPALVFIMFGINDQMIYNGAGRGAFRVPPKQFAWHLSTMANAIRQSGATVVMITIRPIIQGPADDRFFLDRHGDGGNRYPFPDGAHGSIRAYNNIIRGIASHSRAILVDVWGDMVSLAGGDSDQQVLAIGIDRPGEHNDGVHLGPKGHLLVAQSVIKALERHGITPGALPPSPSKPSSAPPGRPHGQPNPVVAPTADPSPGG